MKSLIPKFAFALLGILVLAAALLSLGQREAEAHPLASSYNPSGLSAFRELLIQNGLTTEVTRLEVPKLHPNDLVVAPYYQIDSFFSDDRVPSPATKIALKKHLSQGGRILALPYRLDFRASSAEVLKAPVNLRSTTSTLKLEAHLSTVAQSAFSNLFSEFDDEDSPFGNDGATFSLETRNPFPAWKTTDYSGAAIVTLASSEKGILANVTDGIFLTNRFIDRADDAQLGLALIQGLIKPGGRVVFVESTLGESIEPSLVGVIGPWAVGAWMQILVLFGVIVLTLGVRFGLPVTERRTQQGQRELIDAIADVYRRSRSSAIALDAAYVAANQRIRRAYKLPAGIGDRERDHYLPDDLAKLLYSVDRARTPVVEVLKNGRQKVTYPLNSREARELLAKLETKLDECLPVVQNRLS